MSAQVNALLVIHGAVTQSQTKTFLAEYDAKPKPQAKSTCEECNSPLVDRGRQIFLVTPEGMGSCFICEVCVKSIREQLGRRCVEVAQ